MERKSGYHAAIMEDRPVAPELLAKGEELVRTFRECFWFRHPEAEIRNIEDLHLLVQHMREYGGWREWRAAQDLHQCL